MCMNSIQQQTYRIMVHEKITFYRFINNSISMLQRCYLLARLTHLACASVTTNVFTAIPNAVYWAVANRTIQGGPAEVSPLLLDVSAC